MTIDRTRGRATNQNKLVERTRDRIILEHKDLQMSHPSRKSPGMEGKCMSVLQFRGEKYLNNFIVTNANDCPNQLSHGATFRVGVLLSNYPEENVVKGENVPNFKINTSKGASSNVFQILQDLQLKQHEGQYHLSTIPSTVPKQYGGQYHLSTVPSTTPKQYEEQHHLSTMHINSGKPSSTTHTVQNTAQSITSFRTTTPSTDTTGQSSTGTSRYFM